MFIEKPLIYHLINKHNKKFNPNKLFLSKGFRKKDEWFMKKIFAPFFAIAGISASVSIFLIKGKDYQTFGMICCLFILLILFTYRYLYFNRKAKKDTGYKVRGNKISDFFKWWLTKKQQKKQLNEIRKHYNETEFQSLIETAQLEYDFQKGKIGILHFEAMLVSILAVILTLIIELDIIKGWLLKINNGKELTFEENSFVFKNALGVILIALITYCYVRWNFNQGYRDKKRKLKHFIQMMCLARGTSLKKNFT